MSVILYLILIPFIIYITNLIVLKFEILKIFFFKNNIPYTGCFILLISLLFILKDNLSYNFFYFILLIISVFITQKKFINSKIINFFIKFIFLSILVIFFKLDGYIQTLNINNLRIPFIDFFLQFEFFSYFFVIVFIVLNIYGIKKIDSINGLSIGYVFIITIVALLISPDSFQNKFSLIISDKQILFFLITTFFLTIFSMLDKIRVGESGLYLLGTVVPIFIILLYKHTINISPFFIILIFWYPLFELIFSIIKKKYFKFNSNLNETDHYHELLKFFLKKRFKKSEFLAKNFTIIIINAINLLTIYIGSLNLFFPKILIFLLFLNITLYIISYLVLIKFKSNN